jgi:formate C-acetyltransferase
MGSAVNVKLHPSAVGRSPAQRAKFVELLRTYFDLGGAQLQPTCASAEMLRAAQQQPEEYRDLVVKVGGYSSYFTELGPEIQQEIIDRTEHA